MIFFTNLKFDKDDTLNIQLFHHPQVNYIMLEEYKNKQMRLKIVI